MDPVTAPDGKDYERSALKIWLTKKKTSPMTNLPFETNDMGEVDLKPNDELRKSIVQYIAQVESTCL